jgi:hypothetical protein
LGPVHEWLQPGIGHGRRQCIVVNTKKGMGGGQSLCVWLVAVVVSCEEGLESKHHWETVMMREGMRVLGRISSGEALISLLRSSVWVSGQMAKTRSQPGLVEKSCICVCCWNAGHVCWCGVRSVVLRKNLGQRSQQRDHPMELRTLLGRSRKISECNCYVCD